MKAAVSALLTLLMLVASADARPRSHRQQTRKPVIVTRGGPTIVTTGKITAADLRWPCSIIRAYRAAHTEAEAIAEGKANGIVLSAREAVAVRLCLEGKL